MERSCLDCGQGFRTWRTSKRQYCDACQAARRAGKYRYRACIPEECGGDISYSLEAAAGPLCPLHLARAQSKEAKRVVAKTRKALRAAQEAAELAAEKLHKQEALDPYRRWLEDHPIPTDIEKGKPRYVDAPPFDVVRPWLMFQGYRPVSADPVLPPRKFNFQGRVHHPAWRNRESLVRMLKEAQSGICPYCDEPVDQETSRFSASLAGGFMGTGLQPGTPPVVDHIIPFGNVARYGGCDGIDNLQLLHAFCNILSWDAYKPPEQIRPGAVPHIRGDCPPDCAPFAFIASSAGKRRR